MSEALTRAVIALASRLCRDRGCGLGTHLGTASRPLRCDDCPLDDVDALYDASTSGDGGRE